MAISARKYLNSLRSFNKVDKVPRKNVTAYNLAHIQVVGDNGYPPIEYPESEVDAIYNAISNDDSLAEELINILSNPFCGIRPKMLVCSFTAKNIKEIANQHVVNSSSKLGSGVGGAVYSSGDVGDITGLYAIKVITEVDKKNTEAIFGMEKLVVGGVSVSPNVYLAMYEKCASITYSNLMYHTRLTNFAIFYGRNKNVLVNEKIDGMNLNKFIKSGVAPNDITRVLLQVLYLTEIISKNNIYHNDLHDGNIMIKDLGAYYIISYGDRQIYTRYVPVIIDAGRSSFPIGKYVLSPDNERFNNPRLLAHMADFFKAVMFSYIGAYMSLGRRHEVSLAIRKFCVLFIQESDFDSFMKDQKDRYTSEDRNFSYFILPNIRDSMTFTRYYRMLMRTDINRIMSDYNNDYPRFENKSKELDMNFDEFASKCLNIV